ncbi:MAG: hypothetical protein WBX38_18085 [Candidatus Sulfotelmatobacter sp.]
MVRGLRVTLALSVWVLLSASFAAAGSTELLTFAGLQNGQLVGNFYNGSGLASTPNYGVVFSSNFYGALPTSQGGGGNFSPTPLNMHAIFFTASASPTYLSVANGFSSGINFFYTSGFQETVTVWSGANGTGTVLATINLAPNNPANCVPAFCTWSDVSINFSGSAESVTFTGTANGIGLADITLGRSVTGIPEPSSFYLLGTGVLALCAHGLRRLKKA